MKNFTDIYTESGTLADFTLGYGKLAGQLLVTSTVVDQQNSTNSWPSFAYSGATGTLVIGDHQMGLAGKIAIGTIGNSRQSILLDGSGAIEAGGNQLGNGKLSLKNLNDDPVVFLSAESCSLTVGCKSTFDKDNTAGQISVCNKEGVETAVLNGANGRLTLGGQGVDGDIIIKNDSDLETIKIFTANGDSAGGKISVCNGKGVKTAELNGLNGSLTLGGQGVNGDIVIKNDQDSEAFRIVSSGNITLGGPGVNGEIVLKNDNDIETIKITGSVGDIEFLNADLAEEFDVAPCALSEAVPGMVVVLDEEGRLVPCAQPYDSSVVGILAGAGSYRAGIVLDKRSAPGRRPVTLIGKAFCWVDAQRDPVRAGDLLTTSANPGYAMRAASHRRAAGAVVGKALRPLPCGTGLIPVLVKPN
ncbi:MAG: hypothetical protein C5B46_04465 [Proteobacteria bacterium]|nr:MAG: hypothetical protein C5B46_04465 [Pseudomonadota bacterium]